MLEHIKKLFLAIIAITCFTCFQRADYNLPLFAFAYFLWDYKHPNVKSKLIIVTKAKTLLPLCCYMACRFYLACILGRYMEFRRVSTKWLLKQLHLCTYTVNNIVHCEGKFINYQL